MSAGIITAIIVVCAMFVAALSALVYWYAFRFEPVNFKVSNIKINLMKNSVITNDTASITGKYADITGKATGIFDKAAINSDKVTNLSGKVTIDSDKITGLSANSTGSADKATVFDFTILHLSDFHLRRDRKGEKLFEFIRSLRDCNPDFIFITGDLVEKNENFDYLVDMLSVLKAKTAKYAVLGIHDYYNKTPLEFIKNMIKRKKEYKRENDVSGLISKLGGIGIKVLRNESISHILSGDLSIKITGLEDSIIGKTDIAKAFGKYRQEDRKKETLYKEHNKKEEAKNKEVSNSLETIYEESIDKEEKTYKAGNYKKESISNDLFVLAGRNFHNLNDAHKIEICLTHTPDMDLFDQLVENGVDIVLAGHTHGGQVRLPGIGAIIAGCNMKAKYASGLFYFKKFVLYVSRGLGEGRYSPFRFYCPPEATVIKVSFI